MRKAVLGLLLVSSLALCADATELIAGGVYYDPNGSPKVSGWATYARQVSNKVYTHATIEGLPVKLETGKWVLSARYLGGTLVHVAQFFKVDVYGLGELGAASTTGNTALAGSAGVVLTTRVHGPWRIHVPIKWTNSTSAQYQVTVGLGIGWGRP